MDARRGRITGTRLKDLVTKGKPKKGFWEIISERVAIPASEENVMARGKRLEDEAIERLSKELGKKFSNELVIWHRDEDENIAISPDGYYKKGKKITEAAEVKCLNGASHIEAYITKEIPSEYQFQVLQYFIVSDTLETLYFVFYDPRCPRDFFYHTVHRGDIKEQIDEYLSLERNALVEMERITKEILF